MQEISAVKAMLSKEVFLKYSSVLYKLGNLEPEIRLILNSVKKYYEQYKDKTSISVNELKIFFKLRNPHLQNIKIYEHFFHEIETAPATNPDLIMDVLNRVVERHLLTQGAEICEAVVKGTKPTGIRELENLIQRYRDISGGITNIKDDVCTLSLKELLAYDAEEGLNWRLRFLQEYLGPIKKSTLGHIFGRPDSGKTSLALSEVTQMARQLKDTDQCILFLNNEESIKQLRTRAFMACLRVSKEWLKLNPDEAEEQWQRWEGNRINFIPEVTTFAQVEKYIDAFRPVLCVIDQGPKINIPTGKNDDGVRRLQILYNKYRALAAAYETCIITLGQADKDAENKKYLQLNNIDGSKVAVQGELDFCLGIGMLLDAGYEEVRWLNVVKNKLTGLRGNGQVSFVNLKCRFED